MKRLPIIVGIAAAMTLATAGVVLADSGAITDPRGDVQHVPSGQKANYDIVRATWGEAKHGKLVHQVTVVGKVGDPQANGHTGPLPSLLIKVPHHQGGTSNCDYMIESVPPGAPGNTTNHLAWFVYTCSNGPNAKKSGAASAARPDAHTIKLVFSAKAIGTPSKYGWAFVFPTDTKHGIAVADRAPDSGFKTHRLK